MLCPLCSHNTKVLESRVTASQSAIRRRRECLRPECKARFSTIEEIEILDLSVIKRDGRKERYSKDKLVSGIKKALSKCDFEAEAFIRLIADIERDIQITTSNELITAEAIGEIVMKHLKKFHQVGYVRFASVYREFKDPSDFAKEINKL